MIRQIFLSVPYTQILLYRKDFLRPENGVRYIEVSVLNKFYYKDVTAVSFVFAKSVPFIKVSALRHGCYIKAPLY